MTQYLNKAMREAHDMIAKGFIDKKLLIKAGWLVYRKHLMPADAGAVQIAETEQAFYAGAQHLFASIMGALDEDAEPTEDDMRRMSDIHEELNAFADLLRPKMQPRPRGSA